VTERSSAKLVYFADVARKRGVALGAPGARRDSEPGRTRLEIAAVLATVFLMVMGWVAAQGLTQLPKCPQPNLRVCGP
jgi:hypothetical protein